MVEYIMKKEICGKFHAKCGTRDLTWVLGTVPRKAGRVVTLQLTHIPRQMNPIYIPKTLFQWDSF
jgi:hypothetical protein